MRIIHVTETPISHTVVPAENRVEGHAETSTGAVELGQFNGSDYGIWEMSEGEMFDVEADELFLVVSGKATVYFLDTAEVIDIQQGDLVRLNAGERTRWQVTEPLRKIYVV